MQWSAPQWFSVSGIDASKDLAESEAELIDLRRALDFLLSQPDIDTTHIAYVVHDFGAMFGACWDRSMRVRASSY